MEVVLRGHWQLEVDDVGQLLDVDAPGRHLGRDEDRHPAHLEVVERADALRLAAVAVDRGGRDPVLHELFGEAVRAVLGAGEDERLVLDLGPEATSSRRRSRLRSRSTRMTTCGTRAVGVFRGVA